MISVNNEIGAQYFDSIKSTCIVNQQPLTHALEKNQAFKSTPGSSAHLAKQKLTQVLKNEGPDALVQKMTCPTIKKNIVYAKIPKFIKNLYQRIKGAK